MKEEIKRPAQGGPFNHVADQGKHENQITVTLSNIAQKNASGLHDEKLPIAHRQVAIVLSELSDDERREYFQNLYPLPEGESLAIELQKQAAEMCDRFEIAGWIGFISGVHGWRLIGFGMMDLGGPSDTNLYPVPNLEWLRPGNNHNVVRLVVGDEPQIHVSTDGGLTWLETSFLKFLDALSDWCEGGPL